MVDRYFVRPDDLCLSVDNIVLLCVLTVVAAAAIVVIVLAGKGDDGDEFVGVAVFAFVVSLDVFACYAGRCVHIFLALTIRSSFICLVGEVFGLAVFVCYVATQALHSRRVTVIEEKIYFEERTTRMSNIAGSVVYCVFVRSIPRVARRCLFGLDYVGIDIALNVDQIILLCALTAVVVPAIVVIVLFCKSDDGDEFIGLAFFAFVIKLVDVACYPGRCIHILLRLTICLSFICLVGEVSGFAVILNLVVICKLLSSIECICTIKCSGG